MLKSNTCKLPKVKYFEIIYLLTAFLILAIAVMVNQLFLAE